MAIQTTKFIRKPLYVDAVRITNQNFDEIVAWCQGEVQQDEVPGEGTGKKYIKVRVHNPKNPRQTKAFVGDWLLYTERGYKVYTNKAFRASFDKAEVASREQLEKAFGGGKSRAQRLQRGGEVPTDGAAITQVAVEPKPESITAETPQVLQDVELQSVGPVAEAPNQENGVGEIQSVESPEMAEARRTIEAEGGSVSVATPQAVADAATDTDILRLKDAGKSVPGIAQLLGISESRVRGVLQTVQAKPGAVVVDSPPEPVEPAPHIPATVEDVAEQEKIVPAAAEGKRVLSVEEQAEMDPDEIRELIRSGEVVLAQDIA